MKEKKKTIEEKEKGGPGSLHSVHAMPKTAI